MGLLRNRDASSGDRDGGSRLPGGVGGACCYGRRPGLGLRGRVV